MDDLIYGKELPYTIADRENLFTFVPKSVIKKYVKDEAIREKALALMKAGKWCNPLFYKADKGLKHNIYSRIAFWNQNRKFKRYFH